MTRQKERLKGIPGCSLNPPRRNKGDAEENGHHGRKVDRKDLSLPRKNEGDAGGACQPSLGSLSHSGCPQLHVPTAPSGHTDHLGWHPSQESLAYATHFTDGTTVRQPSPVTPGIRSISLFFRVPLSEIGYVRAIVEGHEGIAYVRSQGECSGEIEWLVPEPLLEDARHLAEALEEETGMHAVEPLGRSAD